MGDSDRDLTQVLKQLADDPNADAGVLVPIVYAQLRAIARNQLSRERPGHTLQATALVNEAYMKLFGGARIQFNDRKHFFCAAAEAMRRVLLEHARRRGRIKRGGKRQRVSLDAVDLATDDDPGEILAVDEAIGRLERQDAELAQVVKLRFFAGLSCEEAAQALGTSERTIRRDWKLAKAWLSRELGSGDAEEAT